jgi:MraZ protein
MFTGAFPLTIDAKNRLSIPYVVRDRMMREADGKSLYVVPGRRRGTLALYPDRYYERTRQTFLTERVSDATYAWVQFEYSQAALLDADNQGRVLLPDRLLKRAGLDREVTLIGVHDHLELWNRPAFEEYEEQRWSAPTYEQDRFAALQELQQLGIVTTPAPAEIPAAS